MGIGIAGWPAEAYDLLLRLNSNSSSTVLQAHREEHDRLVRQPMQRLCEALGVVGGHGRAWPSARNADPVTWLRTGATVWIAGRVRMTALFDLTGLHVAGGWIGKSGTQLWRFRAAVDADHTGEELASIVVDLDKAGYAVSDDGSATNLTRVPRGYPENHPRAELLRRRSLVGRLDLGTGSWVHSAEVVDHVRAAFDPLLPLTSWFVDHVATDGCSTR